MKTKDDERLIQLINIIKDFPMPDGSKYRAIQGISLSIKKGNFYLLPVRPVLENLR